MGEHDEENVTVLCRPCHSWLQQQTTPADSPVEILFAANRPLRTDDVTSELSVDLAVSSVRERLWVLMGLDNLVESRDRKIVDKDVETSE